MPITAYTSRGLFQKKEANAIMSRGVQLPDLFECLPVEEARREFYYELETIRALCLKLLVEKREHSTFRMFRSRNANELLP